jgi:hypothetical protein
MLRMCGCLPGDEEQKHLRVGMQAKFWKLRQSELEGYNYLYSPIKMRAGDLSGAGMAAAAAAQRITTTKTSMRTGCLLAMQRQDPQLDDSTDSARCVSTCMHGHILST